jgi:hypothetical protein
LWHLAKRAIQTAKEKHQEFSAICSELVAEYPTVNKRSLRKKIKQLVANPERADKHHGHCKFSREYELVLVSLIQSWACSSRPFETTQIIDLVRNDRELPLEWEGKSWMDGFMARWGDRITLGTAKQDSGPKNSTSNLELIEGFLARYRSFYNKISFDPDFVINGDETPVGKKGTSRKNVLVSTKAKKRGTITSPDNILRTVLPFVAASGKTWMTLYIFKDVHRRCDGTNQKGTAIKVKNHPRLRYGSWPRLYASTKNGFMTGALWLDTMEKLSSIVEPHRQMKDVLLFVDHFSAHHDINAGLKLIKNNIITLFIPAGLTSFMQPLDMHVNAALKNQVRIKMREHLTNPDFDKKDLAAKLQEVLPLAEKEALTETTIRRAWKDTGLYPFDEDYNSRADGQPAGS